MTFECEKAIALLKKHGAQPEIRGWRIDDALVITIEENRWIARVYLARPAPDDLEVVDQWRAMGWSVQSLEHFLRVWRPVEGSYRA